MKAFDFHQLSVLVACVLVAPVFVPTVEAQPVRPPALADLTITGTAFRVFVESGEPTMEIMIMGAANPGVYRVGQQTSLLRLLALAGGVNERGSETDEFIQTFAVEVYRPEGDAMQLIYAADPEQMLREPGRHPILQDGDLVTLVLTIEAVPNKITVGDVLDVFSRVASVASVILLLTRRF